MNHEHHERETATVGSDALQADGVDGRLEAFVLSPAISPFPSDGRRVWV